VPEFSSGKMIKTGQQVDLYLTDQKPAACSDFE